MGSRAFPKEYHFRIMSLNVRGINSLMKQRKLNNLISDEKVEIIALNETKLTRNLRLENSYSC